MRAHAALFAQAIPYEQVSAGSDVQLQSSVSLGGSHAGIEAVRRDIQITEQQQHSQSQQSQ